MQTIEIQVVAEVVAQQTEQAKLVVELQESQLAFIGGGVGLVLFD